jgi:hypothetical protein
VSKQKFPTCAAWLHRAGHGAIDLHGRRIGKMVVLMYAGYRKKGRDIMWLCQCDCGERVVVRHVNLAYNMTGTGKPQQSCGCARLAACTTHGQNSTKKRSRALHSYWAMRKRCEHPKDIGYKNYGARGIRVCDRWRGQDGIKNFLADMGPRPRGKTLDREDVNGNYEPSNCRWATKRTQANNKRPKAPKHTAQADVATITGVEVPF